MGVVCRYFPNVGLNGDKVLFKGSKVSTSSAKLKSAASNAATRAPAASNSISLQCGAAHQHTDANTR